MSEHPKIVLSLKGTRNDDPWFVVHATSTNEAMQVLGENFSDADEVFRKDGDLVRGLLAAQAQYRSRTDQAAQYYAEKALHNAGAVQEEIPLPPEPEPEPQGYQSRYGNQSGGGYQQAPAQQNAPAQRSYGNGAAEPSNSQTCKHGERTYRKGANYEAMFCPAPKGTPDQCDPLFKDKRTGAWNPPKPR